MTTILCTFHLAKNISERELTGAFFAFFVFQDVQIINFANNTKHNGKNIDSDNLQLYVMVTHCQVGSDTALVEPVVPAVYLAVFQLKLWKLLPVMWQFFSVKS